MVDIGYGRRTTRLMVLEDHIQAFLVVLIVKMTIFNGVPTTGESAVYDLNLGFTGLASRRQSVQPLL